MKNIILPVVFGVAFCLFLEQSDLLNILQVVPQKVFVSSEKAMNQAGVKFLDPNWDGVSIHRSPDDSHYHVDWKSSSIHIPDTFRVKRLEGKKLWVVNGSILRDIDGTMQEVKSYPVVIDTGNASRFGAAITDSVLADGSVEFLPMDELGDGFIGIVHLCQLKIGSMTLVHPPCVCWKGHYEKKWLGMTQWQEKELNLGLDMLKNFSYILLDHPAGEVEFGGNQNFDPNSDLNWKKYPMKIESYKLFVEIPINHQSPVFFDSGAGAGLVVAKKQWENISQGLKVLEKKKAMLTTPIHGYIKSELVVVESLSVGDFTISNAAINITENENPFGELDFTLGVGFFQDKQVAVDFTTMNLWIKQ